MPIIGGSSESVAAFIRNRQNRREVGNGFVAIPKNPIVIGGSGYGSIKDISLLAAMNLLGVKKPNYVTGYGGAGPIRLAFERAEINFTQETAVGISKSVLPWVREGWTSVLYQVGFLDGKGNVIKDSVWKEIGIDSSLDCGSVQDHLPAKTPCGASVGSGERRHWRLLPDSAHRFRAEDTRSAGY